MICFVSVRLPVSVFEEIAAISRSCQVLTVVVFKILFTILFNVCRVQSISSWNIDDFMFFHFLWELLESVKFPLIFSKNQFLVSLIFLTVFNAVDFSLVFSNSPCFEFALLFSQVLGNWSWAMAIGTPFPFLFQSAVGWPHVSVICCSGCVPKLWYFVFSFNSVQCPFSFQQMLLYIVI